MRELKKFLIDLRVCSVQRLHERYVLLRLTADEPLPDMRPGQFVEVRVDASPNTFLRRPISINFVDRSANELWLLVATVGDGTRRLARLHSGDTVNCLLPLGHGFSVNRFGDSGISTNDGLGDPSILTNDDLGHSDVMANQTVEGIPLGRRLLVGGGVGVAPLLYLGATLQSLGVTPTFLLGARTSADLLMLDEFRRYGRVFVTTEDGSEGEKGFVTQHSLLQNETFDLIQTCGPTPMMKAVAHYARQADVECEVSLENLMACGLGACLCCVEKTTEGHVCVCKEGPVFNVRRLLWQI